jgi:hypothetical protein
MEHRNANEKDRDSHENIDGYYHELKNARQADNYKIIIIIVLALALLLITTFIKWEQIIKNAPQQ